MAVRGERVEVSVDARGDPSGIRRGGRVQTVAAVHERWRLEDGWWGQEEQRCYYRVQTSRGAVFDIYHDLVSDEWYLDRVHD